MTDVTINERELVSLRLAAEHEFKVRELAREVSSAKVRWDAAKDASLAAKKNYDQLSNELREFIAEGPGSQLSLFPASEPSEPAGDAGAVALPPPTDSPTESVESSIKWEDVSVDDMGFSEAVRSKLREIGVHNAGQAEQLRAGKAPGFPKGAASVDRWGVKRVAEFEDVMVGFVPVDHSGLMGDDASEPGDDFVEGESDAEGAEGESPALAIPGGQMVRIRLTRTLDDFADKGWVNGFELDAEMDGPNLWVTIDDEAFALKEDEYELVADVEAVAAE